MSYQHWGISLGESRKRKKAKEELKLSFQRIVEHEETVKKTISDFPDIHKYLSCKFPTIGLLDVPIYVALSSVVDDNIGGAGGCFHRNLNSIIVKNEIKSTATSNFDKVVQKICPLDASVEDVVVHELIHAVSFRMGRSSSKYRHMEEEFVYTNCIDFYKQKGMSNKDIVINNFFPFCFHDVCLSRADMRTIIPYAGVSFKSTCLMSTKEYKGFLNTYADIIVPLIKEEAKKRALHMIELYYEFGAEMYSSEKVSDVSRFSTLDLGPD